MSPTRWTDDEVRSLNDYQSCGRFHPFTCIVSEHGNLVATNTGWTCPVEDCEYRQFWAHDWMLDRSWER